MKRLVALVCVVFMLISSTANASFTGAQIYIVAERAFSWLSENVSPLGGTDSAASDYYVMAQKRAGKAFDYGKYIKITNSQTPATISDAQRIIMANTVCGGRMSDEFVGRYTYNTDLSSASHLADAMTALLSGEYKIKSRTTDINRLAVRLLGMQGNDGCIGEDTLSTSKSIIALSFLSGNCYIEKGEDIGEKYRYDVNTAILRAVNFLQNTKLDDYGFGSIKNTAYAIMALDSVGVDTDNDPGFSDGDVSTLSYLINRCDDSGKIGNSADDTALAVCALVSHLRAMQGNSMFYALKTVDMPYNPLDYVEDINHSGEGLKIPTQTEIELKQVAMSGNTDKPYEITNTPPTISEASTDERKSVKVLSVVVVVMSVIILTAMVAWFVVYMLNVRPAKKFHRKETEDEDG